MKSIVSILIAAILYFLFAKLGLIFAIPPGFASAIWPAAGVGLAVYLLRGKVSLIGIFLGSFFANLNVASTAFSDITLGQTMVPLCLALGTCLQLFAAKHIVLKVCALPIQLDSGRPLVNFLLIIGPLSCCIASTIGALTLSAFNDLTLLDALFIWFTWWVGDTLGTMFFAPLILLMLKNDYFEAIHQRSKVILPSLILFTLVSAAFIYSRTIYVNERQHVFEQDTKSMTEQLNIFIDNIEHQLFALAGFFYSSESVTKNEFSTFVENIRFENSPVRAIAWIPKINDEQREAFEQQLASDQLSNLGIKHLDRENKVSKSAKSDFYLPIQYISPLVTNQKAVGLNLKERYNVKHTLKKAIETGSFTLSDRIRLAQQRDKRSGLIVYYPLFQGGTIPERQEQRSKKLLGLVSVVFEVDTLFSTLDKNVATDSFGLQARLNDGESTDLIFSKNERENADFTVSTKLKVFNKELIVDFNSSKQFDQKSTDWNSWTTLVFGSLISIFSLLFIMSMMGFSSRLERIVSEKTKELQKKNKELLVNSHAKSRFLANMSHEYRTPLNAIIGFAQIATMEVKDKLALSYFEKIMLSSSLLLNIINNVLDLSKLREGKFKLESIDFRINETIKKITTLFTERANTKGLRFTVESSIENNLILRGDQIRLEQILVNLCDNAIKFTEKGEVKVVIHSRPLEDNRIELGIDVIDQGIGIAGDKLESLFSSFTQEDLSTTRQFGGTGLGLSISKDFVELMGGSITIDSEKGVGSTFKVRAPFILSNEDHLRSSAPKDKSKPVTHKQKIKALVVEDNQVNQLIAEKLLASLNVDVSVVDDGQQSLDFLQKNDIDIIFMDLHMPVMDGFSAIRKIKSNSSTSDIPIAILSASVTEEEKLKAKALGIEHYVTKPFHLSDLESVLSHYFNV